MDASEDSCAFEILFMRNVPHILEKIFFSLDYRSFQSCFRVNGAWNELLSSQPYQKMSAKKLIEKEKSEEKLWHASQQGNLDEVKKLISSGSWLEVNCVLSNSLIATSPLIVAASGGHRPVVQVLLDSGAEPDLADSEGWTPLLVCACSGRRGMLQLLLDRGADPNKAITSERGFTRTPLEKAVDLGSKVGVQLLLEHGADPNKEDKRGWTPLHNAAQLGLKKIVKLLLQRGADHNKTDIWGWTPLSIASEEGHEKVVHLLSQYTQSL